jgi:hypothetical protein
MSVPFVDPSPLRAHGVAGSEQHVEAPLTDAQRDFAATLGRLLAVLWHDETALQPSQNTSASPGAKIGK